jgi:hypothetical protein
MVNKKLKFENFKNEKLSKNQQKAIQGGDDPTGPIEPGRGNGKGSN